MTDQISQMRGEDRQPYVVGEREGCLQQKGGCGGVRKLKCECWMGKLGGARGAARRQGCRVPGGGGAEREACAVKDAHGLQAWGGGGGGVQRGGKGCL